MNNFDINFALEELEEYENSLIFSFNNHVFFKKIPSLESNIFDSSLLQRRYISHLFTPLYDLAIDHLDDKESKKIARKILDEEYPNNKLSHRELLMVDLMKIGISKEKILYTAPSEQTLNCINASLTLLTQKDCSDNHHQIRILTFIRFFGEVLVAIEYRLFWKMLEIRGLRKEGNNRSVFYEPHIVHDSKQKSFTENYNLTFLNHSDKLTIQLKNQFKSLDSFELCKKISNEILSIKTEFYNQFI